MRRVKLTIAYDGTAYRGFQLQPNGITIQSVMEEALGRLLRESVRIRAAGRTDTGVHGREQVIDFADSGKRTLGTIVRGGNALLPPDIRILSVKEVPPSFDAQRHAKSKEYRYFLYIAPVASPFFARYAWHLTGPVDLEAMRGDLAHIVGRHDFSSFRGQGCTARTTVREIFHAGIETEEVSGLYSLRVAGGGQREDPAGQGARTSRAAGQDAGRAHRSAARIVPVGSVVLRLPESETEGGMAGGQVFPLTLASRCG
jgi:tRNA pseudouridine38-40 synthase